MGRTVLLCVHSHSVKQIGQLDYVPRYLFKCRGLFVKCATVSFEWKQSPHQRRTKGEMKPFGIECVKLEVLFTISSHIETFIPSQAKNDVKMGIWPRGFSMKLWEKENGSINPFDAHIHMKEVVPLIFLCFCYYCICIHCICMLGMIQIGKDQVFVDIYSE
jgi:hypothetical protein